MKTLIGIVSKNRAGILPKAIDSAFMQVDVPISVSVFDDASTDDTKGLQVQYPKVDWFFASDPLGYVYARNRFMQTEGFQYFCSLDDDSWFLEPTDLSKAVQYLESHPEVAAIAFDILSPDQPTLKAISAPKETNTFIGCGHVLRLSAVREVGFYHKNPGFYGGEEKDLCIRLMDCGYKIVKMPGVHVWHDKTNVARDLGKQHRSGVCNDMVFTFRRTPLLLLIPSLLLKSYKHLRFSYFFPQRVLWRPGYLGLLDFYWLLMTFKIKYGPVQMKTFWAFKRLTNS